MHQKKTISNNKTVGGVSAAVSKTAAAPIERVKLLIQNQVRFTTTLAIMSHAESSQR